MTGKEINNSQHCWKPEKLWWASHGPWVSEIYTTSIKCFRPWEIWWCDDMSTDCKEIDISYKGNCKHVPVSSPHKIQYIKLNKILLIWKLCMIENNYIIISSSTYVLWTIIFRDCLEKSKQDEIWSGSCRATWTETELPMLSSSKEVLEEKRWQRKASAYFV